MSATNPPTKSGTSGGRALRPGAVELSRALASVRAGVGPAVVSTLAVREQLEAGALRVVEVEGLPLTRRLRGVAGTPREPRRLTGPAGELVATARRLGQPLKA